MKRTLGSTTAVLALAAGGVGVAAIPASAAASCAPITVKSTALGPLSLGLNVGQATITKGGCVKFENETSKTATVSVTSASYKKSVPANSSVTWTPSSAGTFVVSAAESGAILNTPGKLTVNQPKASSGGGSSTGKGGSSGGSTSGKGGSTGSGLTGSTGSSSSGGQAPTVAAKAKHHKQQQGRVLATAGSSGFALPHIPAMALPGDSSSAEDPGTAPLVAPSQNGASTSKSGTAASIPPPQRLVLADKSDPKSGKTRGMWVAIAAVLIVATAAGLVRALVAERVVDGRRVGSLRQA